jgi:hypothetical protein
LYKLHLVGYIKYTCSDYQCSPRNISSSESSYCHNGEGSYFGVLGYGTV